MKWLNALPMRTMILKKEAGKTHRGWNESSLAGDRDI